MGVRERTEEGGKIGDMPTSKLSQTKGDRVAGKTDQ